MNIQELTQTEQKRSTTNIPLIAGPCSAETREQVLAIAESLCSQEIQYFRAGIWKPRTRPGSFEGVGTEGLQWLKEVKEKFGLKTCTEVANANHTKAALEAGVDMLWIGARTSANPFAVQEIADTVKGHDIPVYIKNPINPDLNLWIGAIERFQKAGIQKIGAIHRGFSSFADIDYRNEPQWQIPIDLKEIFPNIPLVCDPSHIGGKRDYIQTISQKAMDLNFDGLMIETHLDPDKAWSDAKQQVTPNSLNRIMDALVLRKDTLKNGNDHVLTSLRENISNLDAQLLNILESRMNVSEQIGKFKRENGLMILQSNRWKDIKSSNKEVALKRNLNPQFVDTLYKCIHQESISVQEKIVGLQE
jgi:chorismate mutase